MSSHVHHEIYLHLNWHTKNDHPILSGTVEQFAHRELLEKCCRIKGVRLHKLGGTDTHVHLAVQIEPFVCISELVGELKGASAHEVNHRLRHKALEWQRGYGVVSFGRRNLEWVCDYIARQREHHASRKVEWRLEAAEGPEEAGAADRQASESPAEAG